MALPRKLSEPSKDEVDAWMVRTGADAWGATDHFWPDVRDEDKRRRIYNAIRQRQRRARIAAGLAPVGASVATVDVRGEPVIVPAEPRVADLGRRGLPPDRRAEIASDRWRRAPVDEDDEPDHRRARRRPQIERARLPRLEFLEWQLSEIIADIETARDQGNFKVIGQIDARITDVRDRLDAAHEAAGAVVRIDRTPEAIAADIGRRAKQIEQLQRAHAAKEREL